MTDVLMAVVMLATRLMVLAKRASERIQCFVQLNENLKIGGITKTRGEGRDKRIWSTGGAGKCHSEHKGESKYEYLRL